jgi:NTP pyrophosphatase (non-canonical NTP hydrolase)
MPKSFNEIYREVGEFSVRTFVKATPVSQIKKLKGELDELEFEVRGYGTKEDTLKEVSDCFLALSALAYKLGYEPEDLLRAMEKKMNVNRQRVWKELPGGIYQHVEHK